MNPMQMAMQAMRGGLNPQQVLQQQMQTLQQQAANDPRARQLLGMVQGKTPQQLDQLARNLFASSGRSYDQFAQSARRQMGG